jgi:uncharacterized protein YukE
MKGSLLMSIPDDGDTLNVSTERLRETAGNFKKTSQDTFTLLTDLQGSAKQLVEEMYSELHHSPAALERLCERWSTATHELGTALQEVANNLATGANNYEQNEKHTKNSFQ